MRDRLSSPWAADGGRSPDLAAWRGRLLAALLAVPLWLGLVVAIPSAALAWHDGHHALAVVDTAVLLVLVVLRHGPGLGYRGRALGVLATFYGLGLYLLLEIGPVGQVYLLSTPVMAILLLGLRAAVVALFLNAVALLIGGLAGPAGWNALTAASGSGLAYGVIALNTLFVDVVMVVSAGLLLQGLSSALARQRASAERLRLASAALSRLHDIVLITDTSALGEPMIAFSNEAFTAHSGFAAAQALGRAPAEVLCQDPEPMSLDEVQARLRDGQPVHQRVRQHNRQGETRWLELDVTPLQDGQDAARHWVWLMRDVTERTLAEESLRVREETFRQIAEQVPGVVYRLTMQADGRRHFSYISPGVRDLYGYSPEDVASDPERLLRCHHPEDWAQVDDLLRRATEAGLESKAEFRITDRAGRQKWVQLTTSAAVRTPEGWVRSGLVTDISERKFAEEALRDNERRWKLALEAAGDGVWDWDLRTGIERYSDRFREMYGLDQLDLPEMAAALDRMTHPDDVAKMEQARQDHFEGRTASYENEHRIRCHDGSWKWILSRGMVIERDADGRPLRMIGTHTDITRWKQSEAVIWQQANFDTLTGLPNRRMLRDRLGHELARCLRTGGSLALMFIDLDHFKEVNDTLGHDHGDLLLMEAAHRISHCVRATDTVARMGGDEFTVLLPDLAPVPRVEHIAEKIIAHLSEPFSLGGERVHISASVGIALAPQDAHTIDELLKQADQALYAAKGSGRNRFCYFTLALQDAAQTRMRLANDLHEALAQHQLTVHYQPIVDLATGRPAGAEALLRWNHPVRGAVNPAQFVPIAESTGTIIEIGEWVLREALTQVQRWRAHGHPDFHVSVNKSPVQFRGEECAGSAWPDLLARMGLPGDCLSVEITEGLLLEASDAVTERLLGMKAAGIRLSLDDFGTGFSSLSYLHRFRMDTLKIDKVFVRDLEPGGRNLALCKAIIGMAHELGMQVVAEGVETPLQRDLLRDAGCDHAQGYLFARPMPAEALDAWLAASVSLATDQAQA